MKVDGNNRFQLGSSLPRLNHEYAVKRLHTLAHIAQSDSSPGIGLYRVVTKADAIIDYRQSHLARRTAERHASAGCMRMTLDIGKRFLRHPKQRGIHRIGQGMRIA